MIIDQGYGVVHIFGTVSAPESYPCSGSGSKRKVPAAPAPGKMCRIQLQLHTPRLNCLVTGHPPVSKSIDQAIHEAWERGTLVGT